MSIVVKVRNRAARVYRYRWRMAGHRSPAGHIVIGGSPRSGTTLLRRLFDRHPAICCGPESSLFLPGYIDLSPLASDFGLDAGELAETLRTSPSQGAFIDAFATRYLEVRGRSRWAEKTPLNVRYFGWILERFPEARLVHVVRDGRDVACSMREHPGKRWQDGRWQRVQRAVSLDACARRWVSDTAAGMRLRGDPRYLEVRYEDLVERPDETLRRLCQHIGEPADADWLGSVASPSLPAAPGAPVAPGALTQPDAQGVISTGSVGRWRRDLSDEGLASVLTIAGDRLRELGYPTGEG